MYINMSRNMAEKLMIIEIVTVFVSGMLKSEDVRKKIVLSSASRSSPHPTLKTGRQFLKQVKKTTHYSPTIQQLFIILA